MTTVTAAEAGKTGAAIRAAKKERTNGGCEHVPSSVCNLEGMDGRVVCQELQTWHPPVKVDKLSQRRSQDSHLSGPEIAADS